MLFVRQLSPIFTCVCAPERRMIPTCEKLSWFENSVCGDFAVQNYSGCRSVWTEVRDGAGHCARQNRGPDTSCIVQPKIQRLSLQILGLMGKSSCGAKIGGTAFWRELAPSWQAYPFTLCYNAVQRALKAQIGGGPGLSFSRYWSLSQSHNKLFGGAGGAERSLWLRLEQVWREYWDILYFEWLAFFLMSNFKMDKKFSVILDLVLWVKQRARFNEVFKMSGVELLYLRTFCLIVFVTAMEWYEVK